MVKNDEKWNGELSHLSAFGWAVSFWTKSETEWGPALMQNQHTRELVSAWKTSHTHMHNNKDLIHSFSCLAWEEIQGAWTLPEVHQVEFIFFMYLILTCMPDESYPRQLLSLFCVTTFKHQLAPLCVDSWLTVTRSVSIKPLSTFDLFGS